MPKLRKRSLLAAAFIGMLAAIILMGCGSSPNQDAASSYDPETGHPTDWLAAHGAAYLAAQGGCAECHGADYKGGISKVGCFEGSLNGTACHAGGPSGHQAGWAEALQHGVAAEGAFSACKSCHGADYTGGIAPVSCYQCHNGPGLNHPAASWVLSTHMTDALNDTTVCKKCHGADYKGGGSNIACSSCHMENESKVHMAAWYPDVQLNHRTYAAANGTAKCAMAYCHGTDLTGVSQSGPSCSTCHAWPLTAGGTQHATGWDAASQHGVAAEGDFSACKSCHGADYKGGTASVSCYLCHNGPGLNHPAASFVLSNHMTDALNNITVCKKCHGTDYKGGGSKIACNSCHMENESKVHMAAWYPDVQLNHRAYAKTNGTAKCATAYCHGTDLKGVSQSGPSCSSCHTWPFTSQTCGSCHGTPPDGSASPNTAGRHAVHAALSGVDCAACHKGAGSETALHQNGTADVIADSAYNAKSGAASFNAAGDTCSKVSCHGGQTTPNWLTGSIDVNTQCASCHVSGTTEYNSYNSGKHTLHIGKGYGCTECHDTAKLSTMHFTGLGTTAMPDAAPTILTNINYTGSTCTVVCHGKTHTNKAW